jgi:hypothetical protein
MAARRNGRPTFGLGRARQVGGNRNNPPRNGPGRESVGQGVRTNGPAQEGIGGNQHVPTPPKGQHWVPGEKYTPITPFLSAQDMMDTADAWGQYATSVADIDLRLAEESATIGYTKEQNARAALMQSNDVRDNRAARGLQSSSIRDGELFDVDATLAIRNKFLDDQLTILRLDADRRKTTLSSSFTLWNQGMNQQMVNNAIEASANRPPPKPGHWAPNAPRPPQQAHQNDPIQGPRNNPRGPGQGTAQNTTRPIRNAGAGPIGGGRPVGGGRNGPRTTIGGSRPVRVNRG